MGPTRISDNLRIALTLALTAALLAALWSVPYSTRTGPRGVRLAAEAGGVEFLNVTVTDSLQFTLSADEVTPGDLVRVTVTQLGTADHTFTLSPTAGYTFPQSDSSSDLLHYFSTNAPLVNIQVSGSTGSQFTGNFTAPPYGLYEYVCTEPGHFPQMSGILGSGEAGSTINVDTGPGAPVFIIVGVITALVIIALVLGFVVGKRRGAHEEMPPERLGYPEPPAPVDKRP